MLCSEGVARRKCWAVQAGSSIAFLQEKGSGLRYDAHKARRAGEHVYDDQIPLRGQASIFCMKEAI